MEKDWWTAILKSFGIIQPSGQGTHLQESCIHNHCPVLIFKPQVLSVNADYGRTIMSKIINSVTIGTCNRRIYQTALCAGMSMSLVIFAYTVIAEWTAAYGRALVIILSQVFLLYCHRGRWTWEAIIGPIPDAVKTAITPVSDCLSCHLGT